MSVTFLEWKSQACMALLAQTVPAWQRKVGQYFKEAKKKNVSQAVSTEPIVTEREYAVVFPTSGILNLSKDL